MRHPTWMQLLRDPRDAPLAAFVARSSALLPLALAVFVAPETWAGLAAFAFIALYAFHIEPFITMFHDLNHRRLFRSRSLNGYVNWVLGPLHGSTPNTYFVHHVLMHHTTNNLDADESSTLRYRRDSIVDFGRYYLRFFFSLGALCRFVTTRYPRRRWAARLVAGELGYLAVATGLAWVDLEAAIVVCLVPLVATRSLLIMGNWAEHAFVDLSEPDNPFKSSTELVGKAVNRRSFNVGYHISHHVRPGAHFTQHPAWFEANRDRYGREDAVVFSGLNYPHLWLLLMLQDYDGLARRFVRLPSAPDRSDAEVAGMLRERVRPLVEDSDLLEAT